ncbi:MAG: hypothetical protein QM621_13900 [Aeromicrobium sp.]|uniref:hypothetical protein n=1 Tax=Aeromicrobium sp. TaxID=1871063 RepID=UPI0039E4304F
MTVDAATAQLACSVTLAAITVYLTTMAALHHDDRAGRTIAVAFLTISATGALALTFPGDGTVQPLAESAAAGGYVLGFGLLRSGLRLQQHGGSSQLLFPFLAAGITLASGLPDAELRGLPVPLALSASFSAAFATATFVDAALGPHATAPSSRALQALMGVTTLSIVVTGSLTLLRVVDWTEIIDVIVAVGTLVVFSVAALCLSSLRGETARRAWWTDRSDAPPVGFEVNGPAAFRREALDRVDRARSGGVVVGLLWVEVEQFDDLGTAFGPEVQDQVVVRVGAVLRAQTPPFATLGHLGDGRFAVLTRAHPARPLDRVAGAVRRGLDLRAADLPVAPSYRVGAAVEGPDDIDLGRLIRTARADADMPGRWP